MVLPSSESMAVMSLALARTTLPSAGFEASSWVVTTALGRTRKPAGIVTPTTRAPSPTTESGPIVASWIRALEPMPVEALTTPKPPIWLLPWMIAP